MPMDPLCTTAATWPTGRLAGRDVPNSAVRPAGCRNRGNWARTRRCRGPPRTTPGPIAPWRPPVPLPRNRSREWRAPPHPWRPTARPRPARGRRARRRTRRPGWRERPRWRDSRSGRTGCRKTRIDQMHLALKADGLKRIPGVETRADLVRRSHDRNRLGRQKPCNGHQMSSNFVGRFSKNACMPSLASGCSNTCSQSSSS